ncbi:AAA family ATPase [Ramlibacter terrae]|uniref:AAA family ATPase n=1 Tax=Ramlibacter terrae TaxID=2732511 RepID=A0ABX6P8Y9_9BURK|nr:AAA family ATPase [Ramlibacter terrae]
MLLKSLFKDFAQLMQEDASAVPLISCEAYANGEKRHSFKEIYKSLLEQLVEPGTDRKSPAVVKDGKLVMQPATKQSVGSLRMMLEDALRERRTRVGVIDEAAHLLRLEKGTEVMDTLKSLSNTSGTKWVLVGSFDLFDLIADNGQVARRANILNLGALSARQARRPNHVPGSCGQAAGQVALGAGPELRANLRRAPGGFLGVHRTFEVAPARRFGDAAAQRGRVESAIPEEGGQGQQNSRPDSQGNRSRRSEGPRCALRRVVLG